MHANNIISGNIDYEKIYADLSELIENQDTKLNNISNKNLSYTMIEYYTLIAMTCLYGGTISVLQMIPCMPIIL